MGSPVVIINGEEPPKKEEKKPERRNRRRGSGKNKKKLGEEAVKKYKEDQVKRMKQVGKHYFILGALGLPAGMIFLWLLKQYILAMTSVVIRWISAMTQ
jgi:hypothetical protein